MTFESRQLERSPDFGAADSKMLAKDTTFRFGTSHTAKRAFYATTGKRIVDLTLVFLCAPAWIVLVLVLAALVKLDGGPAFYSQSRIGKGGRVFRMWKLRSMVVDADERLADHLQSDPKARAEWIVKQKLANDPRITRFGKFIRATSLDELPQLLNVAIGDMSLVGPRPMMVDQRALYPGTAYYQLRPGVTGLWQVATRNNSSFKDRAVFDEQYYQRSGFIFDFGLILKTFVVVLKGRGA